MRTISLFAALSGLALATPAFAAEEFAIGKQIERNHLALVPHYLTGIEMEPMPAGMAMGDKAVHLEVDVHAMKGEPHGFAEGAWMPYLTVHYKITKTGSDFSRRGELLPMTAGDGPHYANNLELAGPGEYHVSYTIEPPSKQGFIRHVDKASGVPTWWEPFTVDWTFTYPVKK